MRPISRAPRPLAQFTAAAVAALALTVAGLLVATPASAHDELVSTDPASGATVEALPPHVTLTFTESVSNEHGATEVKVTDAAGANLAVASPTVQDNVVTQPLRGPASGVVTVLWKVVSADGHPVSGQFTFTVAAAATPTPVPTVTVTVTPTPVDTPSASPSPTLVPTDNTSDTGPAWPWIVGLVILLAVIAAVAYLLVSRSRRRREKAELDAAAQSPTGGEPPTDR
jgi:methionine-rich copper-binding protein CopC